MGQAKSHCAREAALRFAPGANIKVWFCWGFDLSGDFTLLGISPCWGFHLALHIILFSIQAYRDDVMKPEYGINFFKGFRLCLNALDNRKARNHVNRFHFNFKAPLLADLAPRMCLAADIPLVESGTAGYLGQVTVIR